MSGSGVGGIFGKVSSAVVSFITFCARIITSAVDKIKLFADPKTDPSTLSSRNLNTSEIPEADTSEITDSSENHNDSSEVTDSSSEVQTDEVNDSKITEIENSFEVNEETSNALAKQQTSGNIDAEIADIKKSLGEIGVKMFSVLGENLADLISEQCSLKGKLDELERQKKSQGWS
jgi:hypothetical protein